MAIKRFTIEIDDTTVTKGSTIVPDALTGRKTTDMKRQPETDFPSYELIEQTDPHPPKQNRLQTTGKTFPDLIHQFIDSPRAMATILMFLPFVIFVGKIDSIDSFKYPLMVGGILNIVWFSVPVITAVLSKLKKLFN